MTSSSRTHGKRKEPMVEERPTVEEYFSGKKKIKSRLLSQLSDAPAKEEEVVANQPEEEEEEEQEDCIYLGISNWPGDGEEYFVDASAPKPSREEDNDDLICLGSSMDKSAEETINTALQGEELSQEIKSLVTRKLGRINKDNEAELWACKKVTALWKALAVKLACEKEEAMKMEASARKRAEAAEASKEALQTELLQKLRATVSSSKARIEAATKNAEEQRLRAEAAEFKEKESAKEVERFRNVIKNVVKAIGD